MFIRNSDPTKLSFPPIQIRDKEQRSQNPTRKLWCFLYSCGLNNTQGNL